MESLITGHTLGMNMVTLVLPGHVCENINHFALPKMTFACKNSKMLVLTQFQSNNNNTLVLMVWFRIYTVLSLKKSRISKIIKTLFEVRSILHLICSNEIYSSHVIVF